MSFLSGLPARVPPRLAHRSSNRSRLATWSALLGLSIALFLTATAQAQLAPAFASTLAVDSAYITGASGATDVAFAADGRAVVTRKSGQVMVRRPNGTVTTIPYPFGGTLDTASEKGLLGVVADPNVAFNNAFYFYVSNGPVADKHRVYRAVLNGNDTFSVDAAPIIGASRNLGPGLEGPGNHAGGGLAVHDGKLYVAVGDTGSNATPPVNKYGSCLNKGNGKILRVNLDGSVPNDNPLVGLASVTGCDSPTGAWTMAAPDRRVFAWGLRNPWRFWVDPRSGRLWIGDVGERTEEEISVGSGNQHYGYPFQEGNQVWGDLQGRSCSNLVPSRPCTAPAYSYPTPGGLAVTGGLIPEGCGWSSVFDGAPLYVFGDSSAGWLRALRVNASRDGVIAPALELGAFGSPVSIRMGPDASLYVVFFDLGAVYRFTPIDRTGADCAPPVAVPSSLSRSGWLLLAGLLALGVGLRAAARQAVHTSRA